MRKHQHGKPLTLGDFIMQVYDACEDKASMIVWFALKTNLLVFPERRWRALAPARRTTGATALPVPFRAKGRPLLARPGHLLKPHTHRKNPLPALAAP